MAWGEIILRAGAAVGLALAIAALTFSAGEASGAKGASCFGRTATLIAAKEDRVVTGTQHADVIYAPTGPHRIAGLGGNDRICTGPGADTVEGGNGSDRISSGGGRDTLAGGRGSDTLLAGSAADSVLGQRGNDVIDGGPGDRDRLDGGLGDDRVDGGSGDADRVAGGSGTDAQFGGPGDGDVLLASLGHDTFDGGPGVHDVLSFALAPATSSGRGASAFLGVSPGITGIEDLVGSPFTDALTGDSGPNVINGGAGSDVIQGGDETSPGDVGIGGPGNDNCLHFERTEECEPGGITPSNGTVVSLQLGGAGSVLAVIDASERQFGGSSNNYIDVTYVGGAYRVSDAAGLAADAGCTQGSQTVAWCAGPANIDSIVVSPGEGDDIATIERSVPGSVPATLDGSQGSDVLTGGRGDDTLLSGPSSFTAGVTDSDDLDGGPGSDSLRTGLGHDVVKAGPGDDLLVSSVSCSNQEFYGGSGVDSISFAKLSTRSGFPGVTARLNGFLTTRIHDCPIPDYLAPDLENIEGSIGDDVLKGDGGPNQILGRDGNDRLVGLGGDDRLVGGAGVDAFLGGSGRDRLFALDGARDELIDCGPDDGSGEAAAADQADPRPRSC